MSTRLKDANLVDTVKLIFIVAAAIVALIVAVFVVVTVAKIIASIITLIVVAAILYGYYLLLRSSMGRRKSA